MLKGELMAQQILDDWAGRVRLGPSVGTWCSWKRILHPKKINGWFTYSHHPFLEGKWSEPNLHDYHVPAVHLQGCTPFIKVAYLSPLYIFGNKATDGTKLDLNIGDSRVWRLDSGPNLQPCSLVASPFRSSEHLWGDGVHGLSGVCMRLHFVADTSNETNPGCLGDL